MNVQAEVIEPLAAYVLDGCDTAEEAAAIEAHLAECAACAAAAGESTTTLPGDPGVEGAVTWQTEAKIVREAVLELPEPQRAATMLAYVGGRSYRQVARELDIPEGTAKSRLRMALATLADRLAAAGLLDR